jgi:DNA polymerase-3 subunit delta'
MSLKETLQITTDLIDDKREKLPLHAPMWMQIEQALQSNRMPQSSLLVGPAHVRVSVFACRLAAILLCRHKHPPCHQCTSCRMLKANTHPDLKLIYSETTHGVIKIEQIRELQQEVYQAPQCGDVRVILIDGVDRMNKASANALLKILEEPPSKVYFILVAEQRHTLPLTILSRCSCLHFPDRQVDDSYLALGEHYAPDTGRGSLYQQRESIIGSLCDMLEGKISHCTLASTWSQFALADFFWILYLISAQALNQQLSNVASEADRTLFARFMGLVDVMTLFQQLKQLNSLLENLSHNIPINATLALEHLLFGYFRNQDD